MSIADDKWRRMTNILSQQSSNVQSSVTLKYFTYRQDNTSTYTSYEALRMALAYHGLLPTDFDADSPQMDGAQEYEEAIAGVEILENLRKG